MKFTLASVLGAFAFTAAMQSAQAADVTLRLHQLLPAQAAIPAKGLVPWAEKIVDWDSPDEQRWGALRAAVASGQVPVASVEITVSE